MNTHYLASLFKPESVVLFGASDKQDSVGGVVFRNLLTSGFEGRIFAINPKRDEVQGQKAYSSLEEIGEAIDLAVVATPAKSIPGIVEECGEHGIKMMLILSAGFRETARSVLRSWTGRRKMKLVSRPSSPRALPPTWISGITWISWSRIRQPGQFSSTSKVLMTPGAS
jgi:predicted CoA-binding protein